MKLTKSFLFASLAGLFILTGCANLKEMGKGVLGISTNEIELARPKAIKRVFACDYNTAYNNTLKALEKLTSYVYAKRSDLIAIYITQEDTTVVGIFFKEIDPANTQLEISSPSTYGRDLMAKKLFPELEFSLDVKNEPVAEQVKEQVEEKPVKEEPVAQEPVNNQEVISKQEIKEEITNSESINASSQNQPDATK